MTLAKRVIPTLLCRGRTLVKGERFDSWRSIGVAMQAAKVHAKRGVDELLILDIAATAESRGPDLDMVRELSAGCFIPITCGGGVRSLQDIDALLRAGADKVAIGAAAIEKDLVKSAAAHFGSQAITCIVNMKQYDDCDIPMCRWDDSEFSQCDPVRYAGWLWSEGAGEILLQSVDRDGTMQGYDIHMIGHVSRTVGIPVIASGGCSGYADMLAAFKAGADACAAGALWAFGDETPRGAAKYLAGHGVNVRIP